MRETRQSGSTRRLWVIPELYSIIPDVVRLKRTVESIRKLIPGIEIILDSGFFSNENLILLKDDSYIIGASLVLKTVKNGLFSASRTVDSSDNVNMYQNGPIFLPFHLFFVLSYYFLSLIFLPFRSWISPVILDRCETVLW